jgi:acetyl-CoA C-acetyltransferase
VRVGVRFDKFDEHATGVLRMDEVDPRIGGAPARSVVQQPNAASAQLGRDLFDVGDAVRQLLQSRAVASDELGDGGRLVDRREQLQCSGLIGGSGEGQHRLANALFLVDLLVHRNHAEVVGVPGDSGVEIGHRDTHVIDSRHQIGAQWSSRVRLRAGGHGHDVSASYVSVLRPAGIGRGRRSVDLDKAVFILSEEIVTTTVIVAGARTPVGRFSGALKDFSGSDLGGIAIKGALDKAGVAPDQVDYVIMGQVLTAGAGQIPARQAAVAAGIPMTVPALTINKVCLSGVDAIALADQLIRAGEFEIVVAGGQESMTQAPHMLEKSRAGFKYGDVTMRDHLAYDGLYDIFTDQAMGALTEQRNQSTEVITREEQDTFAAASHQKAAAAWKNGVFDNEVVPVSIPQRKGEPIQFTADEGIRADTTVDSLGKLRPAFDKAGTVTAGSASQISDGAAAVVVMSKEKAESLGLTWLAEIGAHGVVAGPDSTLQSQPARAIAKACEKEGIDPKDLDVVEINEAFAAVGIASTRELGIDSEIVNVNGGAISIGHPLGMSGARIALHLALELQRRGGGVGAAALCGGGGQGDALIVRVPKK